jgi:hypothetical protein
MLTILTGFTASIAHVVTGPDHLAAITPLSIDSRSKSWKVGLSWGIGHTLGMLLIGLLFVVFRGLLPVEAISKHSDTIIGFLLIGIGIWSVLRIYLRHKHGNLPHTHFHTEPYLYAHIHKHSHGLKPVLNHENTRLHTHPHSFLHRNSHPEEHTHEHSQGPSGTLKKNVLTALGIGIIHGFAGFSHLFALLPSLAFPSVWDSVTYVSAFALGTISTMVLFSFIMGKIAYQSAVKNKSVFLKGFTLGGGILAIIVGIIWIW